MLPSDLRVLVSVGLVLLDLGCGTSSDDQGDGPHQDWGSGPDATGGDSSSSGKTGGAGGGPGGSGESTSGGASGGGGKPQGSGGSSGGMGGASWTSATRVLVQGGEEETNGSTRDLFSFNLDGSDPIELKGVLVTGFLASERGNRLIISGVGGPYLYDADGTNKADVSTLDSHAGVLLSSSGDFISYLTEVVENETVAIHVAPSDGSEGTLVTEVQFSGRANLGPGSPGSDMFVYGDFVVVDAATLEVVELPGAGPRQSNDTSWSPDGHSLSYAAYDIGVGDGTVFRVLDTGDRSTKDVAFVEGLYPVDFDYAKWSPNGEYLSWGTGASLEEKKLLASVDGDLRLLDIEGGIWAVSDDGWSLVELADGSLHAFDLGTADVEVFPPGTNSLVGVTGYSASCETTSGEMMVKAPNGELAMTLVGAPDCIFDWTRSGTHLFFGAESGAIGVWRIGQGAAQLIERESTSPVTRLRSMRNGEGFLMADQSGYKTWIYPGETSFQVAEPEITLAIADLASFAAFGM